MVINDGQLWWIVDFYVTSKNYPNAQFYEDDTSPTTESNYVEPHYKRFKKFNYIRNSGVAIVNAYSGEVSFYAIKDNEVITGVYDKAFPICLRTLVKCRLDYKSIYGFPDYLTRIQAKSMVFIMLQILVNFSIGVTDGIFQLNLLFGKPRSGDNALLRNAQITWRR